MAARIYNESMCEQVDQLLASGKSIAGVASALNVCRETIYEWREKHPEFAKAYKCGLEKGQAYWEAIGEHGVVGDYDKFSTPAWIFTMKNRFRDDYADAKEQKSVNDSIVEKLIDRLVE